MISIERCYRLAAEQGLTVLRMPGWTHTKRRYAVLRTDQWLRLGIHAPYIKYVGLRALQAGLKAPKP